MTSQRQKNSIDAGQPGQQLNVQAPSSNASNNGATQAQSGSEPADTNQISNINTKRDSKMEQLDVA